MKSYRVTWEIDVDGDDPIAAAKEARRLQTCLGTSAVVFDVIDEGGNSQRVDLLEVDETTEDARKKRFLELTETARASNDLEVPREIERFLAVEFYQHSDVWAYWAPTLEATVPMIESSETDRDDVVVYDLDSYEHFRAVMGVIAWHQSNNKTLEVKRG